MLWRKFWCICWGFDESGWNLEFVKNLCPHFLFPSWLILLERVSLVQKRAETLNQVFCLCIYVHVLLNWRSPLFKKKSLPGPYSISLAQLYTDYQLQRLSVGKGHAVTLNQECLCRELDLPCLSQYYCTGSNTIKALHLFKDIDKQDVYIHLLENFIHLVTTHILNMYMYYTVSRNDLSLR